MGRDRRDDRIEMQRNVTIFACCAPVALLIYLIAHTVYVNILETTQAMGSVDPATHVGLDMGFVTMVGGTGVFAVIASIAAYKALRIWLRLRRSA